MKKNKLPEYLSQLSKLIFQHEDLKKLLRVRRKLRKPVLLATKAAEKIGITKRRINFYDQQLFKREKKSKWRIYSIADLMAIEVFLKMRKGHFWLSRSAHWFRIIHRAIITDYRFLTHISIGSNVSIIDELSRSAICHPLIVTELTKECIVRAMQQKGPITVIPVGMIIREFLNRTAVSNFSADVNEKGVVTYKIDGIRMKINKLPDVVYKKIERIENAAAKYVQKEINKGDIVSLADLIYG